MTDQLSWPIFILGAYLLGAVPFGLLIGLARGIDIRTVGSGNIGATNALRTLGKPLGVTCFLLDVLKGTLPALGAGAYHGLLATPDLADAQAWLWLAVGVGAILGHMFPIYLRFKGGKGVATGFGALLGIWPLMTAAALAGLFIWILTAKTMRYVSVASCAAALTIPAGAIAAPVLMGRPPVWPFIAVSFLLAALVIYKHRGNLARVRAGTEPRIGERRDTPRATPSE